MPLWRADEAARDDPAGTVEDGRPGGARIVRIWGEGPTVSKSATLSRRELAWLTADGVTSVEEARAKLEALRRYKRILHRYVHSEANQKALAQFMEETK